MRPGQRADGRRDHRAAGLRSGQLHRPPARAGQVRLQELPGRRGDRGPAGPSDRTGSARRRVAGARVDQQVLRSYAAAPTGSDLPTPQRPDRPLDIVRLDGRVCDAADALGQRDAAADPPVTEAAHRRHAGPGSQRLGQGGSQRLPLGVHRSGE